ncbi:MAG: phospholipase D-like domain-containing protein, partial [Pirellulales bacterium]|nr:phospholipase D-like domain-containing protein [Pirellulales bacterium]
MEIHFHAATGVLMAILVAIMHALGFLTSVHAVMSTRTSQGAIAWAIVSNTFPYLAVPAYWVLGKSKFDDYRLLRHSQQLERSDTAKRARKFLAEQDLLAVPENSEQQSHLQLLEAISKLPLTVGNEAKLLINGDATFDAILAGIDAAKRYVLVQFYILRDDGLGQRLKHGLLDCASRGVRVFVLYDEMGSKNLSNQYVDELRAADVTILPFNTTRGNRFRVNFRNHRKVVVIDGRTAYVGGHNVGDEYLGKHPTLTPWRDTHVAVRGPVVQCIQVPFVEDWNWAAEGARALFETLEW